MMQLIISFGFTLFFLVVASSLLFIAKKNIRARCGSPEKCSCKKGCKKNEANDN